MKEKKRHFNCKTNEILEDHGDYLIIDISTTKHPNATMAVDSVDWVEYNGGRVIAWDGGCNFKYIYAIHSVNRTPKRFHHLVIKPKDGFVIDHAKHGTMSFIDNRKSNLRYATPSQNLMNQSLRRNSTSGICGISWCKGRQNWETYITINGKRKNIGRFDNIEIAIGARQQAERELFCDFSYSTSN